MQRPGDHTGRDPEPCAAPVRPLRRDAARNRQRVLKAASEVFTERGLDVSLDEVARHAGVGVGTVYRRFRTKEDLVEALFVDRIEAVAALAEDAAEAPDPWTGLAHFMEQAAEMLAGDSGLRQLLMFATYGGDRVRYARQRNAPVVTKLVERVQAAGQLRSDLQPTDIPFILFIWPRPHSSHAGSGRRSGAGISPSSSTACARGESVSPRSPSPRCGLTRWR